MASKSEELREAATKRGLANREVVPNLASLSDAMLRNRLDAAGESVRVAHEHYGPMKSERDRITIRGAIDVYFAYRYEMDYRNAQGC